jgi:hypothetical protein
MLRRGDKSKEVREMKSGLCIAGYLSQEHVNDSFDMNTKASIELLQEHEDLEVTGIFDEETKKVLNKRIYEKVA